MSAAIFLLAFISSLCSASPLTTLSPPPFLATSLVAIGPLNTPIYTQPIVANSTFFWIGTTTRTSCPHFSNNFTCAIYPNDTSLLIYPSSSAYMNSAVPGSQNLYVAESGALQFTEPHAEGAYPAGSYTSGFNVEMYGAANIDPTVNFTGGGATAFWACPPNDPAENSNPEGTGIDDPYKIFLDVEGWNDSVVPSGNISHCLPFNIATKQDAYGDGEVHGAYQYI